MKIRYKKPGGENIDVSIPEGSAYVVFYRWTPLLEASLPVFLTDNCVMEQSGSTLYIYEDDVCLIAAPVGEVTIVKL
jgi:hypothetical protein